MRASSASAAMRASSATLASSASIVALDGIGTPLLLLMPTVLFMLLVTLKSTILRPGLICGPSPVATTDTLILPSILSSKIDPTITSASGCTSALIAFVTLSTSNRVKSVPPVMLIRRPLAPSNE